VEKEIEVMGRGTRANKNETIGVETKKRDAVTRKRTIQSLYL
jgi:hypothetical protein